MSSKNVHRLHGFALGVGLAYWGLTHGQTEYYAICAAGAIAGYSAPDWLEIAWWSHGKRYCLIPHRTMTHVVSLWVALLLSALIGHGWGMLSPFVVGFSLSALLHLAFDYLTPMGVPLWPWAPSKRVWIRGLP